MNELSTYNSTTILSEEVFTEIFEQQDEILKSRMIANCLSRAKELGVKSMFEMILKSYQKTFAAIAKAEEEKKKQALRGSVDGVTNFEFPPDSEYVNMRCGAWQADDVNGICAYIASSPYPIQACRHPILPIKRLQNLETGEEFIVLAFKRNHIWKEVTIPKSVIASRTKIVELSSIGILVNSENATPLIKYLADVEFYNEEDIDIQKSTSKLGWRDDEFIPYDNSIVFDGESRFRSIFNSIHEQGRIDKWLDCVKEIRAEGRIEAKMMLASSFASVLVKKLDTLPFIVDLWGETEGGKSVSLMLAASVWANPDESQYIKDLQSTDVSLEALADMLNNLPMMLDDTSKTSARYRDNFEGLVYNLCSGKGKSRSNKELGINRENHWRLCVLTNGEHPLNSYVSQGGAINRILEVECEKSAIYKDPQKIVNTLKTNYGHAGQLFIQSIKMMGMDKVKELFDSICDELLASDKMQKQAIALAVVLTADRIATDYIFNDGAYISMDDAKKALIDRNMVSDAERCYRYLVDKVNMNRSRFDDLNPNGEKWGAIDKRDGKYYAVFYRQAIDDLCKAGGFDRKSFTSWAKFHRKVLTDKGRDDKVKKFDGESRRCVFLLLNDEEVEAEFVEVEPTEIPFNGS